MPPVGITIRLLVVCTMLLIALAFPGYAASSTALGSARKDTVVVYIDLFRRRLILFQPMGRVLSLPIAAGKAATPSPIGSWHVVTKHKDWGGGFGTRWLGLNVPWGIYGIHGTNRPSLVGQSVSAGCIRLKNENIEHIYPLIPLGARVIIDGHPLGGPFISPRELSQGSRGADVQLVQNRLGYFGYYRGSMNGIFGEGMEYALLRFEQKYHIPVDGVVDMTDYRALGLEE